MPSVSSQTPSYDTLRNFDVSADLKKVPSMLVYVFSIVFSMFFVIAVLRLALKSEMRPTQKYVFEAISKSLSVMVLLYALVKLSRFLDKPQTQTRINRINHDRHQELIKPMLNNIQSIGGSLHRVIRVDLINAKIGKDETILNSGDQLSRTIHMCMFVVVFMIAMLVILGFMDAHPEVSKATESVTAWIEIAIPILAFSIAYTMYSNKGRFLQISNLGSNLEETANTIRESVQTAKKLRDVLVSARFDD
jgi:hypothetical protein